MAILDDSSLKIDPYYKTTNGYTHMYLASNDVLMDDDTHTLQTKIDDIDNKIEDLVIMKTVTVPVTVSKGSTYKTTTSLPVVEGYIPIFSAVKGSGSNNVYNYYQEIRKELGGPNGIEWVYSIYTEWKNANTTTNVSKANGSINVLYIRDYHNYKF